MTRLTPATLAVALCFSLVACAGGSDPGPDGMPTGPTGVTGPMNMGLNDGGDSTTPQPSCTDTCRGNKMECRQETCMMQVCSYDVELPPGVSPLMQGCPNGETCNTHTNACEQAAPVVNPSACDTLRSAVFGRFRIDRTRDVVTIDGSVSGQKCHVTVSCDNVNDAGYGGYGDYFGTTLPLERVSEDQFRFRVNVIDGSVVIEDTGFGDWAVAVQLVPMGP